MWIGKIVPVTSILSLTGLVFPTPFGSNRPNSLAKLRVQMFLCGPLSSVLMDPARPFSIGACWRLAMWWAYGSETGVMVWASCCGRGLERLRRLYLRDSGSRNGVWIVLCDLRGSVMDCFRRFVI